LENQIQGKHDKGKKSKRRNNNNKKYLFSRSFYQLSHERKSEERKSVMLSCLKNKLKRYPKERKKEKGGCRWA
jgi:hypothetical protein